LAAEFEAMDNMDAEFDAMENLRPLTDADMKVLLAELRQMALATDKRCLVSEFLMDRSLTCKQAGILLETVKLGLVQRMLAYEVLPGRLSDLPDGLPYILEPLPVPIRIDVEANFRGPNAHKKRIMRSNFLLPQSNITKAFTMPDLRLNSLAENLVTEMTPVEQVPPVEQIKLDSVRTTSSRSIAIVERRQADLSECCHRLRSYATNVDLPTPVYQDLTAVFQALGFPPLPTPTSNEVEDVSVGRVPLPDYCPPGALPRPEPPGTNPPVYASRMSASGALVSDEKKKARPISAKSSVSEESV
jgi:hypothetical protein